MEILDETNQLTACMKNYFVPCVLMQHHEQKIGPQWNIFFDQQDSIPNSKLTGDPKFYQNLWPSKISFTRLFFSFVCQKQSNWLIEKKCKNQGFVV